MRAKPDNPCDQHSVVSDHGICQPGARQQHLATPTSFQGSHCCRNGDRLGHLRECRTGRRRKLQYHSGTGPEHRFAADHWPGQAGPYLYQHQQPGRRQRTLECSRYHAVHDSNPTTSDFKQYNGRLDANVTSKDHAAFAIYWVPSSLTTLNGGLGYQLFNHDQVNDAFSVIWNHTFSADFPERSPCQRRRLALE